MDKREASAGMDSEDAATLAAHVQGGGWCTNGRANAAT